MNDSDIYNPIISIALSSSAGSGKTYALTTRLISMLLTGIRPSEICAITFTNAAAADIRDKLLERIVRIARGDKDEVHRFAEILNEKIDTVVQKARDLRTDLIKQFSLIQISTIHSLFAKIVRAFPEETGILNDMGIIDETVKESVLLESIERFYRSLALDSELFRRVYSFISHFRESIITTKGVVRDIYSKVEDKHYLLAGLLTQNLDLDEIEDEFTRKKEKILSFEIEEKVKILVELLGRFRELEGTKKNVESFYSGLNAFIEYKNINRLIELQPFKRTENNMVNYLQRAMNTLPEQDASLFSDSFSAIRSALVSLFNTQREYYVLIWIDIYKRINKIYRELKNERRVIDFSDIEMYALDFLGKLSDFKFLDFRIGTNIKYILIDEFQDTSEEQWDSLKYLVKNSLNKNGNIFYVGDEKQAIYRWRGGEPSLFEKARKQLNIQKKRLMYSYRQNRVLLDFVNTVFQNIGNSILPVYTYEEQKISPQRAMYTGGYITIVQSENRESMLSELVRQILKLQQEGIHESEMAVLCRKNSEIEEIERLFINSGIPCKTKGKSKLLKDYSIMDVLNIIHLILNPDEGIYLSALLRSPVIHATYDNLYQLKEDSGELKTESMARITPDLYRKLTFLTRRARFLSPSEFLRKVYEEFNLLQVYDTKREVLLHLYELAYTFENTHDAVTLFDFTRYLEENEDSLSLRLSDELGVSLRTIHDAKGLEFHTVILPYLSQPFSFKLNGSLLFRRNERGEVATYTIANSLYSEYLSNLPGMTELFKETDQDYKIDEMNILYVALTRAKENLVILPIKKKNGNSMGEILIRAWDRTYESGDPLYNWESGTPVTGELTRIGGSKKKYIPLDIESDRLVVTREQKPPEPFKKKQDVDEKLKRIGLLKGLIFHRAVENIRYLPIGEDHIERILKMALAFEGENHTQVEREQALKSARASLVNTITDTRVIKFFSDVTLSEALTISRDYPNFIGRIDKILIGNEIEVVDFKTNRVRDKADLEELVVLYKDQVVTYCGALKSIYPNKKVRGFLYFTDAQYPLRLVSVL